MSGCKCVEVELKPLYRTVRSLSGGYTELLVGYYCNKCKVVVEEV